MAFDGRPSLFFMSSGQLNNQVQLQLLIILSIEDLMFAHKSYLHSFFKTIFTSLFATPFKTFDNN